MRTNAMPPVIAMVLLAILPLPGRAADCPSNVLSCASASDATWSTAFNDVSIAAVGLGPRARARCDWRADSLYASFSSDMDAFYGSFDAREAFMLVGPSAGTPVVLGASLKLNGFASAGGYDVPTYASGSASLFVNGSYFGGAQQSSNCSSGSCSAFGTLRTTLSGSTTVIAGQEFVVNAHFDGSGGGNMASPAFVLIGAKLSFGELPPGSALVSCHGDTTFATVSVGWQPRTGPRLLGVGPNPGRGPIQVTFVATLGSPARIQLLDVAGRVLETALAQAAGTGITLLDAGARLAPGAYFVRLTQGDVADIRAVTVLR